MHARSVLFALLIALSIPITAQDMQQMPGMQYDHQHPKPAKKPEEKPAQHEDHDMGPMQHDMGSMQNAPHFGHIASGTNVEPASTPAHMLMWQRNGWMLMLHGAAFLEGNFQGGPRGDHTFDSPNWIMLMEHHALGKGKIEFHQMLSAEPV